MVADRKAKSVRRLRIEEEDMLETSQFDLGVLGNAIYEAAVISKALH